VTATLSPPLDDTDHVRGAVDAPLKLVMFGDFQCPYCAGAQRSIRRVRERLGDELRFVFRHLPIPELHPMARASAEASEAAAAQWRFWEYHDALYAAQARLSDRELLVIARDLGLDADRLQREVEGGRWAARVDRDVQSSRASGARGTPTFFVNGRRHEDVYDAGTLVAALTAGVRG
jgi:protein-disulfide isomerase